MTPQEIDNALDDVSTRLERVRSLYEQYFMGIERTVPSIPRKELDRRIEALRRTQFNNTAKRFKFQTLVQRYTSLKQYWYRTCREIENGTYRKHVQRARRRFGEEATDTNQDNLELRRQAVSAREDAQDDLAAMLDGDLDLDAEMGNVLSQLDEPGTGDAPAQAAAPRSPAARDPGARTPGRETPQDAGKTAPQTGLLAALGRKAKSDPPPAGTTTSPRPSLDPLPPLRTSVSPGRIGSPREQESGASLAEGRKTAPRPAQLSPLNSLRAAPRPAVTGPPAAAASDPTARAAPPKHSPRPSGTPARPAAAHASPAGATGSGAGLTEDRIRAIHASYQAARNQTKATAVSYDKLQRSIRETERQLRQKHAGKNVDFEVSIKDGKAILKPRLK